MCYDGDGIYVAEFPFASDRGDVERTIIEIRDGLVRTLDDAAADGPLPIELSDYVPIRKISLWPVLEAA